MTRVNFFSVLLIISAIVFLPANLFSRVSIGSTDSPQDFSVLELIVPDPENQPRGFRLPQMNAGQRETLGLHLDGLTGTDSVAAMGLQIFNTCNQCVETWNGERWISFCRSDGGEETITSCEWTFPPSIEIAGATWATRNADANRSFAPSPHSPGALFQWGGSKAWSATEPGEGIPIGPEGGWDHTWIDKWGNNDTWPADENPCPEGWEVPSRVQLEALINSGYVWAPDFCEGVNGMIFGVTNPSSFDPTTDFDPTKHLFFPAVGSRENCDSGGLLLGVGLMGAYWGTPPNATSQEWRWGWALVMASLDGYIMTGVSFDHPAWGHSVRCVVKPEP